MLQLPTPDTPFRVRDTSENFLDTAPSGHLSISDIFIKQEGGSSESFSMLLG